MSDALTKIMSLPCAGFDNDGEETVNREAAAAIVQELEIRLAHAQQKRAALIQALETLCAAWAQANREVAQMVNADNIAAILTTEQSMNAIAHMTERRKCESALEDILKAHNVSYGRIDRL